MNRIYIFGITVVLVLFDLLHWILNRIYQPYLGGIDDLLHLMGYVGGVWFILFIGFSAHLAVAYTRPIAERYKIYISGTLVLFLIANAIYMYVTGVTQSGSASYYQAFPLYFSGIIAGMLTYLLSTIITVRNASLAFLITVSVLWVLGPIVIDAMNFVEGGARGTTNLIQNLPILGNIYMISIWLYAIGLFFGLLAFLPVLVAGFYFVFNNKQQRIPLIAVTLSTLALSYNLVNWAGFIWD